MAEQVKAALVEEAGRVAVKRATDAVEEDPVGACETVFSFLFGRENIADWRVKLAVLCSMAGVMIVAEMIDVATAGTLHLNGIYPRRVDGLFGILIAPFLHTTVSQLIINMVPFLILGALVLMREDGLRVFAAVTATIVLGGGLVVWSIGEDYVHVGSTTLVFGYFAYLLVFGALLREWRSALVALTVFVVYGTTLVSMLSQAVNPAAAAAAGAGEGMGAGKTQSNSWLFMISGLGTGVLCAVLHARSLTTGLSLYQALSGLLSRSSGKGEAASDEERAPLRAEA